MKTVVISLLGTERDQEDSSWSPNRELTNLKNKQGHPFPIDQILLIYNENSHRELAESVKQSIQIQSPKTVVTLKQLYRQNPWNFEEAFDVYYNFANAFQPDPDTHYYLHLNTGTHTDQICFFLLAERHYIPAQLLQTIPPNAEHPYSSFTTVNLNLETYQSFLKHHEQKAQTLLDTLKSGIETKNKAFNELIEEIKDVTPHSKLPILLDGPTGAGKTKLAKLIYKCKKKEQHLPGEFISVNCATFSGDLARSELFGHTKGAFTGAEKDRDGHLKEADGGVLFLDEIGELPLDTQAMLLKALDNGEFRPLGGANDVKSDFQLICGTNRDLRKEVAKGRFRKDLLYRINTWTFTLPGLADRREDIEPNIQYELQQCEEELKYRPTFEPAAKAAFLKFAHAPTTRWEGNFRDLHAAMMRMATLAKDGKITEDIVRKEIKRLQYNASNASIDETLSQLLGSDYQTRFDAIALAQLQYAIPIFKSSKSAAEAGRKLFNVSLEQLEKPNFSDRASKFLKEFGLSFKDLLCDSI